MSSSSERAHTPPAVERLDSWKDIAGYLHRDVTTVQRWERREGMPVHRHVHDKAGSVYAFRSELDAWCGTRGLDPENLHQLSQVFRSRPSPRQRGVIKNVV